ncbi:MAG TPA: 4'-phosphopantetheinyl transferase superfamily protein [Kofleriaceae bacterium]|nr:4'-phosphopantetheinyl transferase superfamily protein [Kofleriaceae bacterium]
MLDVYRLRRAELDVHSILCKYVDAPVVARDAAGKPQLVGGAIHFNLSHSGELAVVAVSDAPVGIDVEQQRAIADPAAFARRFQFDTTDQRELMRLWCRKEAWLKARGIGLAGVTARMDLRGWFVADLELAAGYSAAVARAGSPMEICVIDWSGDVTIARKISR